MKKIKRRTFLANSAATAVVGLAGCASSEITNQKSRKHKSCKSKKPMKAGFASVKITPPVGTRMMGFGGRDVKHGSEGVHDDVYARALYLEHAGEKVLIIGYDLCLMSRALADRIKGAIGTQMEILPRQILLNTSHTHASACSGTWDSGGYVSPDRSFYDFLVRASVKAATGAKQSARKVTLHCGAGETKLPLSRRKIIDGIAKFRPNPDGIIYDRIPVCLFKDTAGKSVCLLFSISVHPSGIAGYQISADWPGPAMARLDKYLGKSASLFLQGVGGDSKAITIGRTGKWADYTWENSDEAGQIAATDTIKAIDKGLKQVEPDLYSAITETQWPLEPIPSRADFEAIVAKGPDQKKQRDRMRYKWAKLQLRRLAINGKLEKTANLLVHGIKIGKGLRILALEGEAVAEWGYFIEKFYGEGVTFPLGYSNGEGLYLPVTRQLPEKGYEVDSFHEYRFPSQLAPGMEDVVLKAMKQLRKQGIK